MCGLSGYYAFSGLRDGTGDLAAMNKAVAHRGPDGEGLFFARGDTGAWQSWSGSKTPMTPADAEAWQPEARFAHDIAIGHRRFAIFDLSPGGHQPFLGPEGTALAFNGEIYNHVELRLELEKLGTAFRTRSDAEVLIQAWLRWGTECFDRLLGFWALALWDGKTRRLLLARDRLGKAPLYCAAHAGRLWFSSEIKGLRAIAPEAFAPRPEAAALFARHGLRDWDDGTFYQGIRTFPAASWAWVGRDGTFEPKRFWAPPRARLSAQDLSPEEAARGLRERVQAAVAIRLRADAPVGLELSGGLDSSAIAAAAAAGGASNLAAFTVSFPGTAWDEAPYARHVLQRWPGRFDPHIRTPQEGALLSKLGAFAAGMDEPFHSPNMILNQDLWREMAGMGLRVSLNGAGGDEVFAGYGGEYFGPYLRHLLGDVRLSAAAREFLRYSERPSSAPEAWLREAWLLLPENLRGRLRPQIPAPDSDPLQLPREAAPSASGNLERRLLQHLGPFKMNYWLRSGNTSCMAVPLEVRLPLLDHRVVEWTCRLPLSYLIRDGWMKWALRKAMEPDLPAEVVWRKVKMGFPFPLPEWLRASKTALEEMLRGPWPPFLDGAGLFRRYDALAARYPSYLWRLISVWLWWRECEKRNM